ncbi:hypothetical protein A6X21_07400 [Planctopirus hydrillae]|uniref:Uncharacterized protein n=1 Tax=Planctopirus hydrillae TaxID=1841610 RepID=A0A1C3E998_9PLAN|nr:hypothetical protein A6X21_07400 [Planctopirus hydrillae]
MPGHTSISDDLKRWIRRGIRKGDRVTRTEIWFSSRVIRWQAGDGNGHAEPVVLGKTTVWGTPAR